MQRTMQRHAAVFRNGDLLSEGTEKMQSIFPHHVSRLRIHICASKNLCSEFRYHFVSVHNYRCLNVGNTGQHVLRIIRNFLLNAKD